MDKKPTITPGRGLGNRLLSIATASAIYKQFPDVYWYKNYECNAGWFDLFLNPQLKILDCDRERYTKFCDKVHDISSIKNKMHEFLASAHQRAERINTFNPFYKSLLPSSDVEKMILEIPPKTLGLHLRLTDHLQMTTESYYQTAALVLLKTVKPDYVFICGDTQYKKDELINLFPKEKVLFYETHLTDLIKPGFESEDRDSLKGMQLATAEMFTLSKCKWIYPNSLSSFSMASYFMGRASLL